MKSANPIRVLLADDHPALREGMAAIIDRQADLSVVAEAGDGREAIALAREHKPDVILMDLQMPEMGGLEAIPAILAELPETRIVVLTTFDGDEDIYRALQAGARAYLLKDMGKDQYLEAIRAVHAGQRWIPAEIASRLADRMNRTGLTPRETDVLRLVVHGRSNKEISSELSITEETTKTHLQAVFLKLGVRDRTQAAIAALRQGVIHLE